MIEDTLGISLLLGGSFLLAGALWRGQHEDADRPRSIFGRLGGLMLGLVLAFFGAALLLPARDATPTPGANTNPVDNAVERDREKPGD